MQDYGCTINLHAQAGSVKLRVSKNPCILRNVYHSGGEPSLHRFLRPHQLITFSHLKVKLTLKAWRAAMPRRPVIMLDVVTYTSEYPLRVTTHDWYGSSTHLLGVSSNCGFFIASYLFRESCSLTRRSLVSLLCLSISCFFSLAAENPSVVQDRAWIRRPLQTQAHQKYTVYTSYKRKI